MRLQDFNCIYFYINVKIIHISFRRPTLLCIGRVSAWGLISLGPSNYNDFKNCTNFYSV